MATAPPPPAKTTKAPPPPPPAASTPAPPPPAATSKKSFTVVSGRIRKAHRVVIYGPGGVGKTTLAANIAKCGVKLLAIDLEHGSEDLDMDRIGGVETFADCRAALAEESLWTGVGAVLLDSLTILEELASRWVVANIPHGDKSTKPIRSIEDYGFGRGYRHVYEAFLTLVGDLDRHVRLGRHVILTAHDCTANVPNPGGEDWIRYEPRLQSPKSGKDSIRHRIKEWCDHLVFVGFDQHVGEDGKAVGGGTRTIYPFELPTHWAKSRQLDAPLPYRDANDATLWQTLLK